MAEEFKSGSFREIKVGYSVIKDGKAIVPIKAEVIGYRQEVFKGSVIQLVVYILEENVNE